MKTNDEVVVEETSIPEKQEQTAVPEEAQSSRISQAKQDANRRNSKRSTGPTTPRGKKHSSRNALKHGMLSRRAIYDENGQLTDERLYAFQQDLFQQYGSDDVRTQVLIDLAVADYSRNVRAFEIERNSRWLQDLPHVHRYSVGNRKALIDDLKALADLRAERTAEQDEEASDERDERILESQVPPPGDAPELPMSDNASWEEVPACIPAATDSADNEILSLAPETEAAQDGPETLPESHEEAFASVRDGVTEVPEASDVEALQDGTDPVLSTAIQ
jgi:hypothetical protein